MQKSKSTASPSAEAVPGETEATRIIKKYPNRRLYDTKTSAYITLAEVRRLVMASTQFVVRDAKTMKT